jgi:NAD(P)-dependent dehydrogenase (short-subunit alcohol dehydrogenase family)
MSEIKTAFITGANRGIGLEVARELLTKGFHVFMGIRNTEKANKILAEIGELSRNVDIITIDVNDEKSIQQAVEIVASMTDKLDVLINNAGILLAAEKPIQEITADQLLQSIQTNTLGPMLIIQAFLPLLIKASPARIINVSSGAGALSAMGHWAPAYSISKTALNALTKQFAGALREHHIAVNCVCPGWVRTDMGGSIAPRSLEEGADSIVWLATEAPESLTGRFIHDRAETSW